MFPIWLLSACSSTRVFYDHLDWYVDWQLGDFVRLDTDQKQNFDEAFRSLWSWHRSTQLPQYAALARQVAAASAAPISVGQITAYSDRIEQGLRASLAAAAERAAPVVARWDDAQIAGFLERLGQRAAKRMKKQQALPQDERRRKQLRQLTEQLSRWIGDPTPAQEASARQYIDSLPRMPDAQLLRLDRAWQQGLAAVLARRGQTDFTRQLTRFMQTPQIEGVEAIERHNRELERRGIEYLASVSAGLTQVQRRHLQQSLLRLAQDFEALADER